MGNRKEVCIKRSWLCNFLKGSVRQLGTYESYNRGKKGDVKWQCVYVCMSMSTIVIHKQRRASEEFRKGEKWLLLSSFISGTTKCETVEINVRRLVLVLDSFLFPLSSWFPCFLLRPLWAPYPWPFTWKKGSCGSCRPSYYQNCRPYITVLSRAYLPVIYLSRSFQFQTFLISLLSIGAASFFCCLHVCECSISFLYCRRTRQQYFSVDRHFLLFARVPKHHYHTAKEDVR